MTIWSAIVWRMVRGGRMHRINSHLFGERFT
jgi:hypothetical protein